jgi:hypothetical protein
MFKSIGLADIFGCIVDIVEEVYSDLVFEAIEKLGIVLTSASKL